MSNNDITVEICGTSGEGTIAAGGLLNEAMSRAGFSVIAYDSYPSEIRGFGRCVTKSRFGHEQMLAFSDKVDVLISLNDCQSHTRIPFLTKDAIVLFDNKPLVKVKEGGSIAAHVGPDANLFGVPLVNIALEAGAVRKGKNLAALGAFVALFGLDPDFFHPVIANKFRTKGVEVIDTNIRIFDAGFNNALNNYGEQAVEALIVPVKNKNKGKILVSGNAAIAKGALDAGLELYFGYPITPATPIMEIMAKALPSKGGKFLLMEDEIASIGAVIGGAYAGKRVMTATSGPGLALMTEMISFGVMAEVPAVIIDAQRAGPSTGIPTKTEQSDLHAAVFGGPGDSPRIVIAPTNVKECYGYIVKSLQLAEKYQTPVIMLTDCFLNNRVENVLLSGKSSEQTRDYNIYPDNFEKGEYKRYKVTESGISPRAIPGMEGFVFSATGLEHTHDGKPADTPQIHMEMNGKRHRKILAALNDLPEPEEFSNEDLLDLGLITWGSSVGAALEATLNAQRKGLKVGMLKVTSIYPYHAEYIGAFMNRCREILIPELNFEGQFANLIGHLHKKAVLRMNQTTGEPILVYDIINRVEDILEKINK